MIHIVEQLKRNTDMGTMGSAIKKIAASRYKAPKMKLTKRKVPRLPRDTKFFNHIKDIIKKS